MEVTLICLFLLNPKYNQNEIWSNTNVLYDIQNISNMFWAQCWRPEISFRHFYNFIKMTIKQDLTIFNSRYLPFLTVFYSPFQKSETLES